MISKLLLVIGVFLTKFTIGLPTFAIACGIFSKISSKLQKKKMLQSCKKLLLPLLLLQVLLLPVLVAITLPKQSNLRVEVLAASMVRKPI